MFAFGLGKLGRALTGKDRAAAAGAADMSAEESFTADLVEHLKARLESSAEGSEYVLRVPTAEEEEAAADEADGAQELAAADADGADEGRDAAPAEDEMEHFLAEAIALTQEMGSLADELEALDDEFELDEEPGSEIAWAASEDALAAELAPQTDAPDAPKEAAAAVEPIVIEGFNPEEDLLELTYTPGRSPDGEIVEAEVSVADLEDGSGARVLFDGIEVARIPGAAGLDRSSIILAAA